MNILVIGNGFDLAHGLPTKYSDFLFYCNIVLEIIKENNIDVPKSKVNYIKWVKDSDKILQLKADMTSQFVCNECVKCITDRDKKVHRDIFDKYFMQIFLNENYAQELIKEIFYLVYDNIWIEYFLQNSMYQKENWIDFESEISQIIQGFDKDIDYNNQGGISEYPNKFFRKYFMDYSNEERMKCTREIIIDKLLNDLNRLIKALEIYLCEYVEKIDIQKKSLDIEELSIDFILSFNYTHVFSKLYNVSNWSKQEVANPFDYMHGEADIKNTIEANNMVLGIDEYLLGDRKNKDVEFIAFKKFYQRIFKGTGCEYKKWLDVIQKDYSEYMQRQMEADSKRYIPDKMQATLHHYAMQAIKGQALKKHNIYIFGHSLDVTDKDILQDLILNDNVETTIFYPNKEELGRKIANLVKVIGQDELIRRTGGSTKTIEFRQQQDMVPVGS